MHIRIRKILSNKFKNNYNGEVIPQLEIELLLAKALDKDRVFIISEPEFQLEGKPLIEFNKLLRRRKNGEPIAHILGNKEFFGLNFKVDNNVLIPRPETEGLIELAVEKIKASANDFINILEVGTGSGIIPISIVWALDNIGIKKTINIDSIDISEDAIKIAESNLNKYHLSNKNFKINFINIDVFDQKLSSKLPDRTYDLIISNPPYILSREVSELDIEVKDFEPNIALDGGDDGMKFYERILNLENISNESTTYLFEIHSTNTDDFKLMVKKLQPEKKLQLTKDLFERLRYAVIE